MIEFVLERQNGNYVLKKVTEIIPMQYKIEKYILDAGTFEDACNFLPDFLEKGDTVRFEVLD